MYKQNNLEKFLVSDQPIPLPGLGKEDDGIFNRKQVKTRKLLPGLPRLPQELLVPRTKSKTCWRFEWDFEQHSFVIPLLYMEFFGAYQNAHGHGLFCPFPKRKTTRCGKNLGEN